MARQTKDSKHPFGSRVSMSSVCSDGESVKKSSRTLRRLSSNSVKMGMLNTSQESLERNASADFKQLNISSASPLFPMTVGNADAVRSRNRWPEHVPYDHNRVVLTSMDEGRMVSEDGDYINASFIRGHSTNNGYIATQGPMPGTFDDFWEMVWSQNSRLIAMISRTVEGYQTRSYKYWPEPNDSLDVNALLVTLEWEYEKATHVERKIILKHVKTGESRIVRQLQFLGWPEDANALPSVPSFVTFWKAFNKLHTNDHGPPVVHCSNGSWRSSLLLAMDILYKHQEHADSVDVYGTVVRMREDRAHCFPTQDYYVFLHYALIEACTSSSSSSQSKDDAVSKSVSRQTSSASIASATSTRSTDSAFGKLKQFFMGDSQGDANKSLDEASENVVAEAEKSIGSFIVSPFRHNVVKKKRSSKSLDSDRDDALVLLLGKSLEDIDEEYQIFSSQTPSQASAPASSSEGPCLASAIGPNSLVHSVTLGRKSNFSRHESQVSIEVENGNVPVICIPLNHPFLRRMSTLKHAQLRHSSSLQDSHIISDVTGVLPRQFKKSFLVMVHTEVTSLEFWQVIYDTGSCLIVRVIDTDDTPTLASDLCSIRTSEFQLASIKEKKLTDEISQTKVTLKPDMRGSFDDDDTEERVIKILTVCSSDDGNELGVLSNVVMLRLFYTMDRCLSATSTSLVNVHCSAGLSLAGFLCAAYNTVSNIKSKDEADIYIAARIVQDSIPVSLTKTQYTQLYRLCDLYEKQQRKISTFVPLASIDSLPSDDDVQGDQPFDG